MRNVSSLEGLKSALGHTESTLAFPLCSGQKLTVDGIRNAKAQEMVAAIGRIPFFLVFTGFKLSRTMGLESSPAPTPIRMRPTPKHHVKIY
jgi:hypothetical protein